MNVLATLFVVAGADVAGEARPPHRHNAELDSFTYTSTSIKIVPTTTVVVQ